MKLFCTLLSLLLLLPVGSGIAMDSEGDDYSSGHTTESEEEDSTGISFFHKMDPVAQAFNVSDKRVLETCCYQAICTGDLVALKDLAKSPIIDLDSPIEAELVFYFAFGKDGNPGIASYVPITYHDVVSDLEQWKTMQRHPERFLPLDLAISNNCPDVFYYLIDECHVNVNYCDNRINHPLHTAVSYYNIEFVKHLIAHGANPLYKDNTVHKHTVLESIDWAISMPGKIGQDKVELLRHIQAVIVGALADNDYEDPHAGSETDSRDSNDDFSSDDFSDDDTDDDEESDDHTRAGLPSSSSSRPPTSSSSSLPAPSSWGHLPGGGVTSGSFAGSKQPSFWSAIDDFSISSSTGSSHGKGSSAQPSTTVRVREYAPSNASIGYSNHYSEESQLRFFKLRRKHLLGGIAALAVVGALYHFRTVASAQEVQSTADSQNDTSEVDQDKATR